MRKAIGLMAVVLLLFNNLLAAPAAGKNAVAINLEERLPFRTTLKQQFAKMALRLFVRHPAKVTPVSEEQRMEKKAVWAKWLGIGSLVGSFIPGVNLLCLPAAVAAIILGNKTKNHVKKRGNAVTGIICGWILVGLFLLFGFIVALVTLMPVG